MKLKIMFHSISILYLSLPVLVGLGMEEVGESSYSWPDLTSENFTILVLLRLNTCISNNKRACNIMF